MIDYSSTSGKDNQNNSLKEPVKSKHLFWGFIAVLFFMILIFSSANKTEPSFSESSSSQPQQSLSIGDEAVINWHEDPSDCSQSMLLGTTKESHDKARKALMAEDSMGIAELLFSGEAISVPNCTKVKIIDTALFTRQVRILEGQQIGKSGWISYEFLKQ